MCVTYITFICYIRTVYINVYMHKYLYYIRQDNNIIPQKSGKIIKIHIKIIVASLMDTLSIFIGA